MEGRGSGRDKREGREKIVEREKKEKEVVISYGGIGRKI